MNLLENWQRFRWCHKVLQTDPYLPLVYAGRRLFWSHILTHFEVSSICWAALALEKAGSSLKQTSITKLSLLKSIVRIYSNFIGLELQVLSYSKSLQYSLLKSSRKANLSVLRSHMPWDQQSETFFHLDSNDDKICTTTSFEACLFVTRRSGPKRSRNIIVDVDF